MKTKYQPEHIVAKDIKRIKANAIREMVEVMKHETINIGHFNILEYADKLEKGDG
jgi:hypothetical protein